MKSSGRAWSLAGARALVGDVRAKTERAVAEVDRLEQKRSQVAAGSEDAVAVEEALKHAVSTWVREMEALGVEVKGPWLVDFDNGNGYYCWRWPEQGLDYFHGYDEGFQARIRIQ